MIYQADVIRIAAVRDKKWLSLVFPEAKKLVYGYRQPLGSKEDHDSWVYDNSVQLEEHQIIGKHRTVFIQYEERAY